MKRRRLTVWLSLGLCLLLLFGGCGEKDETAEYIVRGMEALEEKNFPEAKEALSRAQKLSPQDPGVLRALGILAYEEQDYSQAAQEFSRALQAMGEEDKGSFCEDILKYKADAEIKSGNFENAKADYSRLIELDNEYAEYYLLRGRVCAELGDTDGAVSDFRMALSLASQNLDYCEDMYLTLKEHGADEAGAEFLETVLAAGPQEEDGGRYDRACLETVYSRMKTGQYEGALSLLQEVIPQAAEPVRGELLYAEGACYEQLRDFETALEKFRSYRETYGADEALDHEIAFLETRITTQGVVVEAPDEAETEPADGTPAPETEPAAETKAADEGV
ncbi:MAG: tetratricopeptide repeat protein [Lachnospiraceae bacterium]|jgi:Flp pilus assembly protein TadD|nr:tetratricopeptide repeat protein [Lachnospiraceae bacterium]